MKINFVNSFETIIKAEYMRKCSNIMKLFFLANFCILMCSTVNGEGGSKKRPLRDTNQTITNDWCNSRSLEARLQRMEVHIDDKFNGVRREIWNNARTIEQSLTNLRTSTTGTSASSHTEQQLQVVIATLRLISSDLEVLRQNLTEMRDKQELASSIQEVFHASPSTKIPASCQEIKETNPEAQSSVYVVQTKENNESIMVFCEMEYLQGGWLTIHNRFEGKQDFYVDWQEYKRGFGNIAGEHWLGLERIHQLTANGVNELLVQLMDVNDVRTYARYSMFSIGSEEEGYNLKVLGGYEGTAGDSLSYHAGSKFSTKDRDADSWAEGSCALAHGGAWWYKSCDKSNLNGRYIPGDQPEFVKYQSMYWDTFGTAQKGLKYARMMIRPKL